MHENFWLDLLWAMASWGQLSGRTNELWFDQSPEVKFESERAFSLFYRSPWFSWCGEFRVAKFTPFYLLNTGRSAPRSGSCRYDLLSICDRLPFLGLWPVKFFSSWFTFLLSNIVMKGDGWFTVLLDPCLNKLRFHFASPQSNLAIMERRSQYRRWTRLLSSLLFTSRGRDLDHIRVGLFRRREVDEELLSWCRICWALPLVHQVWVCNQTVARTVHVLSIYY